MTIEHLPPDATPDAISTLLARDGAVVVDRLADDAQLDRIEQEMAPWVAQVDPGVDGFSGFRTRRIGGLIARSPGSHELITHPTVLAAAKNVLAKATSFQLHLTQIIEIGPGESGQAIHRDQWAFDFFPFPKGYEVQCNTIWAMTDFDERNGATRVVPGSHLADDRLEFREQDSEPAEMERGSVLIYSGAVYHGGGANHSDSPRAGLNITYNASWLRQEENQYLSVPIEMAKTLPRDLQRLMGYQRGAYALGYIDDLRDPIEVLAPGEGVTKLGELEDAAQRVREES